jgi:CheY-like chemotaxis protein
MGNTSAAAVFATHEGLPVERARILAIDDEPLVLRGLRRVLLDHDLVCVAQAAEALRLLESGEPFDVILCDLMMPEMTGVEFYNCLRKSLPALAHRIVFMTGGAIAADADGFLASVSNLRLEKPFEMESLESSIRQIVMADGRAR